MTTESGAARVTAAAARALIRAMGMQAENQRLACFGQAPAYGEEEFQSLIYDEHIDWNSVVEEARP